LSDDENEIDAILEEDIRLISKLEDNDQNLGEEFKKYFSAKNYSNRAKRFIKTESFGQMRILNPFLFANQVKDGAVLRRVALSPKAFSAQILSPDFGSVSNRHVFCGCGLEPSKAWNHQKLFRCSPEPVCQKYTYERLRNGFCVEKSPGFGFRIPRDIPRPEPLKLV